MIFGEPRVPFERPVQAGGSYVPRSLDTGFVPEFQPYPMIMNTQMARLPAGVHQPLTAEPGQVPAAQAVTAQPPSTAAIKGKSMRMMPIHVAMALGVFPGPRRGGIRSGLNPNQLVAGGRNPGA